MRALLFSACAYAAANSFPPDTSAQTLSFEDTLVDAFLGNCVVNLPNLEKVRAASRLFGWKSLSRDAATMLGPIDRDAVFEGWMASEKTVRYVIGISAGSIGPQPVATCTVGNPELNQNTLLVSLHKKLNLKFLNDEREAGQRYRSWTMVVNGYSVLITLTTMQNENAIGGPLAAAVKLR